MQQFLGIPHRSALAAVILSALLLGATSAEAQKLYRWVDKDGKVHYSDQIPPEAVDQARDELNQAGRTVDRVERARSAEEIAAAEEAERVAAQQRKAQEEQDKMDAILLNSYGSVDELKRSYDERFALVEQTIESAKIGLRSQEKSLAELLAHAAELEQQGKPVPANIKSSIELARKQTEQQRGFLVKRDQDKADLEVEYANTVERYNALRAKADAEAKSEAEAGAR